MRREALLLWYVSGPAIPAKAGTMRRAAPAPPLPLETFA